jgi:hypothetical protein
MEHFQHPIEMCYHHRDINPIGPITIVSQRTHLSFIFSDFFCDKKFTYFQHFTELDDGKIETGKPYI